MKCNHSDHTTMHMISCVTKIMTPFTLKREWTFDDVYVALFECKCGSRVILENKDNTEWIIRQDYGCPTRTK